MNLNIINKLEKKFGKYAIRDLTKYIVMCFAIGYLVYMFLPDLYGQLVFSPIFILEKHQYWRIFTWIFTIPSEIDFFTLLFLFFYYLIGSRIEQAIGTFVYNVYIFGGMILTTVSLLIASIFCYYYSVESLLLEIFLYTPGYGMTYLMLVSIFFIYAVVFADAMVLLFFTIPFKVKWLAYIDLILLAYYFIKYDSILSRVMIAATLLNFVFYYFVLRKYRSNRGWSGRRNATSNLKRRAEYSQKVTNIQRNDNPPGITRHKCAICGRSEKDNIELEFRFCSKCNGNYEYCNEHLFTHEHVK